MPSWFLKIKWISHLLSKGRFLCSLNGHIGHLVMLNIEPRLVSIFWSHSPISLKDIMPFWYLLLDPHVTTYYLNTGVQIIALLDLCTSTLDTRPRYLLFLFLMLEFKQSSSDIIFFDFHSFLWMVAWIVFNTSVNFMICSCPQVSGLQVEAWGRQ